jgi:hypothetical protein
LVNENALNIFFLSFFQCSQSLKTAAMSVEQAQRKLESSFTSARTSSTELIRECFNEIQRLRQENAALHQKLADAKVHKAEEEGKNPMLGSEPAYSSVGIATHVHGPM